MQTNNLGEDIPPGVAAAETGVVYVLRVHLPVRGREAAQLHE